MIEPLTYFLLLLKASLFSTSGTGNLPIVHQDLTERGWADESQFAESLAIGQISPGPSGLWVIAIGYLTYGLIGALLATVAITLPPLTVLLFSMLYRRIGAHPATAAFVRGLTTCAISSFLIVLGGLLVADGGDLRSIAIIGATIALGTTRWFSPLPVIVLAGLAGVLLYR
jgi:chromate transporter